MPDKRAIRDVIEQYFYALDSRNLSLLNECFLPQARISILGNERRMGGPDDIVAAFSGIAEYAATSHFITSHRATINGDTAQSHTLAIAVLVPSPDALISVRGLDYRDDFVRTMAGWRIEGRVHQAHWQFDTEQTAPALTNTPNHSWPRRPES